MRKPTLWMTALTISTLIALVAVMIIISWYQSNLRPLGAGSTAMSMFVIPKGQPATIIAKRLQDEHLVQSAKATRAYLWLSHNRDALQAGTFRLSPGDTVPEIVEKLKHGTLDVWVTIPEGWRAEQVADLLMETGFWESENKETLYEKFGMEEGKLFPDTYLFAKDSTPEQVVDKMTSTYKEKTSGFASGSVGIPSSSLIIASLVEREAKRDEDRPLIAGVLMNRLKIGMALQVDATLQYAKASSTCSKSPNPCDDWWPAVTASDKQLNSPFNTYLHVGLPRAPIANPGINAIRASVSPSKTEYLYYMAEPDGTTHYAKTLAEHNANIAKYLR